MGWFEAALSRDRVLPAYEVTDLEHTFCRLALRIKQSPIGVDARHAFDVAPHRDHTIGLCDNRRIEQLRSGDGDVDAIFGHRGDDAGIGPICRDSSRGCDLD